MSGNIKYEKNVYFDRLIPNSSIDIYILLPIIFKITSSIALQNFTIINPLIIDIIKNILIFYYMRKTFILKEKDYCKKLRLDSKEKINKIIHNALKKKDEIRVKRNEKEIKLKKNLFSKLKKYSPKNAIFYLQGNRMYNEYQERNIDYFIINCNTNSNYNYSKKPKTANWKINKIKKGEYSLFYVECNKYLLSTSNKIFKLGEKVKNSKENNNTWNIKKDSLGNIYFISNGIINGKKHKNNGRILSSNTSGDIKWISKKYLKIIDGWIISKKGKKLKKSISNEEKVKKKIIDTEKECTKKIKLRQQVLSLTNQNFDEMEYDPMIERIRCIGKKTTEVLKKEIRKSVENVGKPEDKTTKTLVSMDKKQHEIHKYNKFNNIYENSLFLYSKIEIITLVFSFIPSVKNFIGQYNSNLISNLIWSFLLLYFYRDLNKKNRSNLDNYCNRRIKEGKTKKERMEYKKDNMYKFRYITLIIISTLANAIIGVLSKKSE